jgi:hypothetical protein
MSAEEDEMSAKQTIVLHHYRHGVFISEPCSEGVFVDFMLANPTTYYCNTGKRADAKLHLGYCPKHFTGFADHPAVVAEKFVAATERAIRKVIGPRMSRCKDCPAEVP